MGDVTAEQLEVNTSTAFSMVATVYSVESLPATSRIQVSFEVATRGLLNQLTVVTGSHIGDVDNHVVLAASASGGGQYSVALSPGVGGWPLGAQLRAAIMVQTEDALGTTGVVRRAPFFGSGVAEYAEQGFSFDPIITVGVGFASTGRPTGLPTLQPSSAPSTTQIERPTTSPVSAPVSAPSPLPGPVSRPWRWRRSGFWSGGSVSARVPGSAPVGREGGQAAA